MRNASIAATAERRLPALSVDDVYHYLTQPVKQVYYLITCEAIERGIVIRLQDEIPAAIPTEKGAFIRMPTLLNLHQVLADKVHYPVIDNVQGIVYAIAMHELGHTQVANRMRNPDDLILAYGGYVSRGMLANELNAWRWAIRHTRLPLDSAFARKMLETYVCNLPCSIDDDNKAHLLARLLGTSRDDHNKRHGERALNLLCKAIARKNRSLDKQPATVV